MNSIKHWSIFITTNTALAAIFYLWKHQGYEGAGNILGAYLWFLVALGFLVCVGASAKDYQPQPKVTLARTASVLRTIVIAGTCFWLEYFWLGSMLLVSSIFLWASMDCARKRQASEPASS